MVTSSEWFESWFDSPYYHVLYQSHDDGEARQFIDNLLRAMSLPHQAHLLDLACGKGRHARYLAEKGYEVTGVDISASNIAYARHFEHELLRFYIHDMRRPFRINYFEGVVNFFTSFGYFNSDQDHLNTLINAEKSLKPGGLFLLDYFNSEWIRHHLIHREIKILDGIEFHIKKTIRSGHVFKHIEFETGGRHFKFRERVRLFTLLELEGLFSAAGLKIRQTFGDYSLMEFNARESRRLIIIAEKPI